MTLKATSRAFLLLKVIFLPDLLPGFEQILHKGFEAGAFVNSLANKIPCQDEYYDKHGAPKAIGDKENAGNKAKQHSYGFTPVFSYDVQKYSLQHNPLSLFAA